MTAPRIMIVEDEALVALMVEDLLTDLGCQISGSFGGVDDAMAYLAEAAAPPPSLDGAVLGVNIGGTLVFPVAERLRDAGIPFVFATGYGALPRPGFEGAGAPHPCTCGRQRGPGHKARDDGLFVRPITVGIKGGSY